MSRDDDRRLVPLKDAKPGTDDPAARFAPLLRAAAAPPPPLPAPAARRIRSRLRVPEARPPRRSRALPLAAAAGVLLVSGVVAAQRDVRPWIAGGWTAIAEAWRGPKAPAGPRGPGRPPTRPAPRAAAPLAPPLAPLAPAPLAPAAAAAAFALALAPAAPFAPAPPVSAAARETRPPPRARRMSAPRAAAPALPPGPASPHDPTAPTPAPAEAPRATPLVEAAGGPGAAPAPAPPAAIAPPDLAPRATPLGTTRPLPALEPATGDSLLGQESRIVSDALKALRVERDPTRALALLDGHAARHPVGALGREADVLRLEALVALGRTPAALALLERMALPARAGGELLVLRGELRAQAGRMREARADFEAALEAGLDEPALVERALYGRASAVSRLGEAGAARTALEAYLARFPRGRHAADVRRALEAR